YQKVAIVRLDRKKDSKESSDPFLSKRSIHAKFRYHNINVDSGIGVRNLVMLVEDTVCHYATSYLTLYSRDEPPLNCIKEILTTAEIDRYIATLQTTPRCDLDGRTQRITKYLMEDSAFGLSDHGASAMFETTHSYAGRQMSLHVRGYCHYENKE
ncbi:hypothetical protein C0J52_08306, partial [Blattella germanica]